MMFAAVLVFGANAWKSSLVVKKILVAGNRVVDTNEILQLAHVTPGEKIYDLDLMVIQRNVESHYFLKDVMVERDLPSTIKISVVERTPIAMMNTADLLYIDPDGVVLPHSISRELFDLPVISNLPAGSNIAVGTTLRNPDVLEALDILSTARMVSKELYYLISEIRLRNGGDIVLYTADGGVPILYGRGDSPGKLVRLETFWNSVVRERGTASLQYIDLRFQDQIVVRWNDKQKTSRTL
jgi:cell division protein FtsQ